MPIGSVLLVLALALLVALIVARPFWETQRGSWTEGEEPSTLLDERERILETLLELDFDHQLGKVPEEIFASQRAYLVNKGAQVLKQLDAQGAEAGRSPLDPNDHLERLIAARKANNG